MWQQRSRKVNRLIYSIYKARPSIGLAAAISFNDKVNNLAALLDELKVEIYEHQSNTTTPTIASLEAHFIKQTQQFKEEHHGEKFIDSRQPPE